MAVRRARPRRVLAKRLGSDADDPARARPGAPWDRRLEHRIPPRGAGGRRLAGDLRGRRGRGRPPRRSSSRSTRRGSRRAGTRPAGISPSGSPHATACARWRRRRRRACAPSPRSRRPASAISSAPGGTTSATVRSKRCWARLPRARTDSPPRRLPRSRRSTSRSCSCTAPRTTSSSVSQSRDYSARDPLGGARRARWRRPLRRGRRRPLRVGDRSRLAFDTARRLRYSTDGRPRLRRRAGADDRALQRRLERARPRHDRLAPRARHGVREPHRGRAGRGRRGPRRTSRRSSRAGPTSRSPGDGSTRATGLVVSEWTATATASDGRRLTWDGVDVFPCEDGRIVRKDVYSAAHRARTLDG